MNPEILLGLMKNFYSNFDMGRFEDRLKIQKIIYLLQEYGLNIGYNYGFYLYGPYSRELTKDAFLMPNFKGIKKVVTFDNKQDKDKFDKFIKFIGKRKDDVEWLEIASSIHILSKQNYNKEKIVDIIKKKHNNSFSNKTELIDKIYNELKGVEMI